MYIKYIFLTGVYLFLPIKQFFFPYIIKNVDKKLTTNLLNKFLSSFSIYFESGKYI